MAFLFATCAIVLFRVKWMVLIRSHLMSIRGHLSALIRSCLTLIRSCLFSTTITSSITTTWLLSSEWCWESSGLIFVMKWGYWQGIVNEYDFCKKVCCFHTDSPMDIGVTIVFPDFGIAEWDKKSDIHICWRYWGRVKFNFSNIRQYDFSLRFEGFFGGSWVSYSTGLILILKLCHIHLLDGPRFLSLILKWIHD